ncbi:MAG: DUF1573 domain-containing protein [Flavobacteriales bacterium]|nr:DUF1573 domain-containing protein [Flavobacteriales bacterium]
MKKTLITACLGLFAIGVSAQETAKPVGGSGAMIQVDKDVHDYGTISQGGNGECTFTVTNIGDAPLILTNCKGSCGCTVPKCDTEPVKPGGKTVVTVRYDTTRIGAINKSVTISSNATNEPEKTVRIKGTVIAGAGTPSPAGTTPQ